MLGLGLLLGHPSAMLLLGAVIYLGWHIYNVYSLEKWFREGKRFHPPESYGIWDEIFQNIYHLQQRNRKRKKKLGKMLRRFQEATSAMPDATVVLSPNGSIEWMNSTARILLGLGYPQDIGQRISNLIRHPDFTRFLRIGDYDNSVHIPSPINDETILSIRVIPYGKDQRLLIARDISHIQKLEQMRRDFVANVSHELRTPLTVLAGYLETMDEDEDSLGPQWSRTVDVMKAQSERMQRIVEDLLMLSRLETQREVAGNESVSVPSLLTVICDDARRISGDQKHNISLQADNDLWLEGSDAELRSLFSNLIFNAVRYTPGGGEVRVEWSLQQDGTARFSVTDTGIGSAAHHLPRLTERFYRVDVGRSREVGGTGLGLAIVKHVLLRHQASLEIKSKVGSGSQFIAVFPQERIQMMEPMANKA